MATASSPCDGCTPLSMLKFIPGIMKFIRKVRGFTSGLPVIFYFSAFINFDADGAPNKRD